MCVCRVLAVKSQCAVNNVITFVFVTYSNHTEHGRADQALVSLETVMININK